MPGIDLTLKTERPIECLIPSCDRTCGNWHPYDPCPCPKLTCEVTSSKLNKKNSHALGCKCPSCVGRRSRKTGSQGQVDTARALGHTGKVASQEEAAQSITITVRPETKKGKQVPAALKNLLETEHFRRAMTQARNGARIGAGVLPAVAYWPKGGGGYLIVEMRQRRGT